MVECYKYGPGAVCRIWFRTPIPFRSVTGLWFTTIFHIYGLLLGECGLNKGLYSLTWGLLTRFHVDRNSFRICGCLYFITPTNRYREANIKRRLDIEFLISRLTMTLNNLRRIAKLIILTHPAEFTSSLLLNSLHCTCPVVASSYRK